MGLGKERGENKKMRKNIEEMRGVDIGIMGEEFP